MLVYQRVYYILLLVGLLLWLLYHYNIPGGLESQLTKSGCIVNNPNWRSHEVIFYLNPLNTIVISTINHSYHQYYLVGSLEHVSIYWECHNPNWRSPSFFRGVGLNHQPVMIINIPISLVFMLLIPSIPSPTKHHRIVTRLWDATKIPGDFSCSEKSGCCDLRVSPFVSPFVSRFAQLLRNCCLVTGW